jgi:hypothetical protein
MQIEREDKYDPIVTERRIEYDGFKARAYTETYANGKSDTYVLDDNDFDLFYTYGNPDDESLRSMLRTFVIGYRNGVENGRNEVCNTIKNALGVR